MGRRGGGDGLGCKGGEGSEGAGGGLEQGTGVKRGRQEGGDWVRADQRGRSRAGRLGTGALVKRFVSKRGLYVACVKTEK